MDLVHHLACAETAADSKVPSLRASQSSLESLVLGLHIKGSMAPFKGVERANI